MMYVRSSLEYYDTLAHLVEILNLKLWELYAFSYEYYTTKSRNSQPLRKSSPSLYLTTPSFHATLA